MTFPVTPTSHQLNEVRARGGYETLQRVLTSMTPEQVTKEVTAAGILGHGGAAFPVGRKWSVIHLNDGQPHYLCANADEGEPGTFKDRWILENAPHLLIESMADRGLSHCRCATPSSTSGASSTCRIGGCRTRWTRPTPPGLLGEKILGTDFASTSSSIAAPGSYVCGEASALITSIEGKKGYPRNRPPRLTVRGLYQRPTVINNVESLSNVAIIVAHGRRGVPQGRHREEPGHATGVDLRSRREAGRLRGRVRLSARQVHLRGLRRRAGRQGLKCIIPGGISTKVLTAADIATVTYDHKAMEAVGSQVGSGGMVVIAEGTCMVRLLQVMLRFYHHESCGQCTPCREGMGWLHRIIDRIVDGKGRPEDIDTMVRISNANDGTTICGMGDAAGFATVGIIAKYRDEFEYYIANGRSKCGGRLEVGVIEQETAHA